MQHETKKITLIINELMTMLLANGAEDIDVNIKRVTGKTQITLIHRNCHYSETLIDKIRHNLNNPRQSEVEGYYWQLVGENDSYDELHLVGAMVDEAEVSLSQGDLYIKISRQS